MKKLVFAAMLSVIMVGPSHASFAIVGDPIEGSSWFQGFSYLGGIPVDFLRADWETGDLFQPPVLSNFSGNGVWSNSVADGGWSSPTSGAAAATGGAVPGVVTWDIHFAGSISDPTQFKLLAYDPVDEVRAAALVTYDGSGTAAGFTLISTSWRPEGDPRQSPIPEPSSIMVLGTILALAGAGVGRRVIR